MSGHHTEEQVQAGFRAAAVMLNELKKLGLENPYVKMYGDASGIVVLGEQGKVTNEQWQAATKLAHSNHQAFCNTCMSQLTLRNPKDKPTKHTCEIAIHTCCGFIVYAKELGFL